MISPGLGDWPIGVSSLPVGMIATFGGTRTETSVSPAAAHAARSCGRSLWLCGSTSSAAAMSSPNARTCWYGDTGAYISIVSESVSCTSSTMITASASLGIGSPVSTQTAWSPTDSFRGLVSDAPTVSAARTATPSMAEAS